MFSLNRSVALAGALLTLAHLVSSEVRAQRFDYVATIHARSGAQTTPEVATVDQFTFSASATLVRSAATSVYLQNVQGREQLPAVSPVDFQIQREFATLAELTARYPSGDYRFSFHASPDSQRTLVVPEAAFPTMCRILNLDRLQDVVRPSWTEILWSGFEELRENGFILVFIEADDGTWELRDTDGTAGLDVAGGSAGVMLDLPPDKTFTAAVQFAKITSVQEISGTDGVSFTLAISETRFSIRTRPTEILPAFTRQPHDVQALDHATAHIPAEVTGLPKPSIRWEMRPRGEQNWSTVEPDGTFAVTDSGLMVSRPAMDMTGTQFRCIATNASGSVTSREVTLTVYPGYRVTTMHTTSPGPWDYTGPAVGPGGVLHYISWRSLLTVRPDGSWMVVELDTPMGQAKDLVVGPDGSLFVTDIGYSVINKVSAQGVVTEFAGARGINGSVDGQGTSARFRNPDGLCIDFAGNLFVADYWNHTIRRITPDGTVTTLAGLAGSPGSTDAAGSEARFNLPSDVAVDAAGFVYVADTFNFLIRKIAPNGVVSTLAGRRGFEGSADGLGTAAEFNSPRRICVDPAGVVLVADGAATLRRITPDGFVLTVAGWPYQYGTQDGVGTSAHFMGPPAGDLGSAGELYSGAGDIRIAHPWTEITMASQPATASVEVGGALTIGGAAVVTPAQPVSYQWYKDGQPIDGATNPSLSWSFLQPGDAGTYVLVAGSGGCAARSEFTRVEVSAVTSPAARLLNLSTRSICLPGEAALIPGFAIEGTGTKRLLIRAVGPTLAQFGVNEFLTDPRIALKRWTGSTWHDLAGNDNWAEQQVGAVPASELADLAARVGAFSLDPASRDAALAVDLAPGLYSVVTGEGNEGSGVAMVEVYDGDSEQGTSQLTNLSNRGLVGRGERVMIPGFVISDKGARTLLVRAVGPTLADHGIANPLPDPRLDIYRRIDGRWEQVLGNDDWSTTDESSSIAAVAQRVGAFPLWDGSRDAAMVVTLPPGAYTVHASTADDTTGVALVEIYLVP